MQRSILLVALMMTIITTAGAQSPRGGGRPNIFAPTAAATGPIEIIAPDAVWLDEDGHHLIATVWMTRLLSATPARKLTITNLRVTNWDTAGQAGFNYVLEGGATPVKGVNTMTFKKTGNDWQIVMIHGAVDTVIGQH
jgi:hypothetical protein